MRPDELRPEDLGGQDDAKWEVEVPVTELPSYWKRFKQWIKHWKETH